MSDRRPRSWSHFRDERDRYVSVCAAWRLSIETALSTAQGRELPRAARVLLAAHLFTAARSKLWDAVFLAQLTEAAQIPGDREGKHTAEYLHAWHQRGALVWNPSSKHGDPSWVGLPGSMARQLPLVGVVGDVDDAAAADPRGATTEPEGGPLSLQKLGLSGPPTEKSREIPRAGLKHQDHPCAVCDGPVGVDGAHSKGLWWCPVHYEAAA